jgi:hypothetical protein
MKPCSGIDYYHCFLRNLQLPSSAYMEDGHIKFLQMIMNIVRLCGSHKLEHHSSNLKMQVVGSS